jgi:hypothetical protein
VALTAPRAASSSQVLRFQVAERDNPQMRVSTASTFVSPLNR